MPEWQYDFKFGTNSFPALNIDKSMVLFDYFFCYGQADAAALIFFL
jgi:hypothetical protein